MLQCVRMKVEWRLYPEVVVNLYLRDQ